MIEIIFQLAVLSVGYLTGTAITLFLVRVADSTLLELNNANLLVLTLPLACALVAESFTHLWLRTPGALGLGGLTLFFPMLVGGAAVSVLLLIAHRFIVPFDPSLPRSAEYLTGWVVVALIGSITILALWRYWPAPRARLF